MHSLFFILGSSLLVKPVLETGATSVNVYFPGGSDEVSFVSYMNFRYSSTFCT